VSRPPTAAPPPVLPRIADAAGAERLADAIAVDIGRYCEDDVALARSSGNLSDALAANIEESRTLYRERVKPDLADRDAIFERIIRERVLTKAPAKSTPTEVSANLGPVNILLSLSRIFDDRFMASDLALASAKARQAGDWIYAWRGHVNSGELAGVEALVNRSTNEIMVTTGVGGPAPTTTKRTLSIGDNNVELIAVVVEALDDPSINVKEAPGQRGL